MLCATTVYITTRAAQGIANVVGQARPGLCEQHLALADRIPERTARNGRLVGGGEGSVSRRRPHIYRHRDCQHYECRAPQTARMDVGVHRSASLVRVWVWAKIG